MLLPPSCMASLAHIVSYVHCSNLKWQKINSLNMAVVHLPSFCMASLAPIASIIDQCGSLKLQKNNMSLLLLMLLPSSCMVSLVPIVSYCPGTLCSNSKWQKININNFCSCTLAIFLYGISSTHSLFCTM